ncbi:hypothetical protein MHYP_G00107000 [Metynnis hypsauchen]
MCSNVLLRAFLSISSTLGVAYIGEQGSPGCFIRCVGRNEPRFHETDGWLSLDVVGSVVALVKAVRKTLNAGAGIQSMLAALELLWDGMRWCSPAPLPPRQPELTAMSSYCRGARSLSASKVEQPLPSSPTRCSITPRAAK